MVKFKNASTLKQLTKPKLASNTQEQDIATSINLRVIHAKCHILDKETAVLNKDIRNI
jgi:hypothetical protein